MNPGREKFWIKSIQRFLLDDKKGIIGVRAMGIEDSLEFEGTMIPSSKFV